MVQTPDKPGRPPRPVKIDPNNPLAHPPRTGPGFTDDESRPGRAGTTRRTPGAPAGTAPVEEAAGEPGSGRAGGDPRGAT